MRALALFLAVALPLNALAYGPGEDDAAPVRQAPSQRLLPEVQPAAAPIVSPEVATQTPVYRSWALWVGLGTLTVGAILVVIAAILTSGQPQQLQSGGISGCTVQRPCP